MLVVFDQAIIAPPDTVERLQALQQLTASVDAHDFY